MPLRGLTFAYFREDPTGFSHLGPTIYQSSTWSTTLDLKEIRQIIEMMKRHDLSLFHLERDGMKIKLKKGMDYEAFLSSMHHQAPVSPVAPITAPPPSLPHASGTESASGEPAPPPEASIVSPMVGTFYRSATPGDPPFVKEGDRVDEGTVVCIIEAMKVMNEIKAEKSGVLGRALVNDGTPVQYDQPLFELK